MNYRMKWPSGSLVWFLQATPFFMFSTGLPGTTQHLLVSRKNWILGQTRGWSGWASQDAVHVTHFPHHGLGLPGQKSLGWYPPCNPREMPPSLRTVALYLSQQREGPINIGLTMARSIVAYSSCQGSFLYVWKTSWTAKSVERSIMNLECSFLEKTFNALECSDLALHRQMNCPSHKIAGSKQHP